MIYFQKQKEMELTAGILGTLDEAQANLSGYKRRHFMAKVMWTMFGGSPMKAEKALGWNRATLSKALNELKGEFSYIDRYYARGRKRAQEHLAALLDDIRQIADRYSQTDSSFRMTR